MADRYPVYPGFRPTDTSWEAAEAISEHVGRLQALARAAICKAGSTGLTVHETAGATGFHIPAIQPRISELRRKAHVIDSGQRCLNLSGKRAIVWIRQGGAGQWLGTRRGF
jgi:hypothetical protein